MTDNLKGFVAPLDPVGGASLYGPPPWHFHGRSLTIIGRCDPDAIAALVPAPLKPVGEPLVRFSLHELTCDIGLGRDFAQRHPERSRCHEAVIGLIVTDGKRTGFYDPFLWCNSDAEIAVGREMFGWPQVAGDLWLTGPDPQTGHQSGDVMAGLVSKSGRPVMELSMTLDAPGELPSQCGAFTTFFTMRVLPDPAGGPTVREVYGSDMINPTAGDRWIGAGELTLSAPELLPLQPVEIVAACTNTISWAKPYAELVDRREVPV